jgi:hypothetical protein
MAAVTAALVLLAVACSAQSTPPAISRTTNANATTAGASTGAGTPTSVPISSDGAQTVALPGGATLVVEPGDLTPGSTVRATPVQMLAPNGATFSSPPLQLDVDGGQLVGSVRLQFTYDPASVPAGFAASDAFEVLTAPDTAGGWQSVPFTVDEQHHLLLVETTHFSLWGVVDTLAGYVSAFAGWLQQGLGQVLNTRAGPPKCDGSRNPNGKRTDDPPSWVSDSVVTNFSNAIVRACVEGEGDDAVIEMVNNRKYPQILRSSVPLRWTWHDNPSDFGDGVITAVLEQNKPSDVLLLPPLSRAAIGVPRGTWFYASFEMGPTPGSLVYTALSTVLDKLAGKIVEAEGKQLVSVLAAKCLTGLMVPNAWDIVQGQIPGGTDLLRSAFTCMAKAVKEGGLGALQGVSVDTLQNLWSLLGVYGWGVAGGQAGTTLIDYLYGDNPRPQFSLNRRADPAAPATPPAPPPTEPPAPQPPPTQPPPTQPPPTQPPPTERPQPGSLSITLTENPFRCDGASRAVGRLSGAAPGERIDFSSPDVGGLLSGTADGAGALGLIWQCNASDAGRSWTVTATGASSRRTGTFTIAGAAIPPPTATSAPAQTWPETTGGTAHTWSNYNNAGGTPGAMIAANTTVQISCKVAGFKVANGNTWWYRIASSPWNDQFYVSADAFYNNGQTTGSLVGTPWVDPSVRNC